MRQTYIYPQGMKKLLMLSCPDGENPSESWRHRAACAGMDPRIFEVADLDTHPDLDYSVIKEINKANRKVAMAVCDGCPVKTECLDSATHEDRKHTIRGGLRSGQGLAGPGRPPKRAIDLDPEVGPHGLRQSQVDAALRAWVQGFNVASAAVKAGYSHDFSGYRAWRQAKAKYLDKPDNCTVRPSRGNRSGTFAQPGRAIALARSSSGHIYLVVRKDSRGTRIRLWLPSDLVDMDEGCTELELLLHWPMSLDG